MATRALYKTVNLEIAQEYLGLAEMSPLMALRTLLLYTENSDLNAYVDTDVSAIESPSALQRKRVNQGKGTRSSSNIIHEFEVGKKIGSARAYEEDGSMFVEFSNYSNGDYEYFTVDPLSRIPKAQAVDAKNIYFLGTEIESFASEMRH